MPYLKLNTNVSISETSVPLTKQLSQLLAKETAKPERYVMIELNENQSMLFAGSSDALAFVECKSIGLSSAQIKSLAASIPSLLQDSLQLAPDRVYIEFTNAPAELWAWNGSTFG